MIRLPSLICLALCASLTGCKTGFNRPLSSGSPSVASIPCDPTAVDTDASLEAKAVLKIIATFSCEKTTDTTKRVLSGQVLGSAGEAQNFDRYNDLFAKFQNTDGSYNTPAVMGIDYVLSGRKTYQELVTANDVIESHRDLGGLVTVSWTPSNPWDSGFNTGYTSAVDLPALTQKLLELSKNALARGYKAASRCLAELTTTPSCGDFTATSADEL